MTDYLRAALERGEESTLEETASGLRLDGKSRTLPVWSEEGRPVPGGIPGSRRAGVPASEVDGGNTLQETEGELQASRYAENLSAPISVGAEGWVALDPDAFRAGVELNLPVRGAGTAWSGIPAQGERAVSQGTEAFFETGKGSRAELPLLTALKRAKETVGFVRGEGRAVTLTLPEETGRAPAWTVEELDRAVERDSRRYDGSSPLY